MISVYIGFLKGSLPERESFVNNLRVKNPHCRILTEDTRRQSNATVGWRLGKLYRDNAVDHTVSVNNRTMNR